MRFKVGDRVIYKGILPNYKGKKAFIASTEGEGENLYIIEFEGNVKMMVRGTFLEPITPKDLLKDGVVATVREGTRFIVFGDKLIENSRSTNYLNIDNFNDELKQTHPKRHTKWDIIKLEFDGEVIWERETKPSEEDYSELLDAIYDQICASEEIYEKDYHKVKELIADFEKEWGLE